MSRKLRIALVGGGIGGLTAALALGRNGFETHVFEQAGQLREIGAGISLSPTGPKFCVRSVLKICSKREASSRAPSSNAIGLRPALCLGCL